MIEAQSQSGVFSDQFNGVRQLPLCLRTHRDRPTGPPSVNCQSQLSQSNLSRSDGVRMHAADCGSAGLCPTASTCTDYGTHSVSQAPQAAPAPAQMSAHLCRGRCFSANWCSRENWSRLQATEGHPGNHGRSAAPVRTPQYGRSSL